MLRVTKKHIFYNIQMLSGNKLALMKLMGFFANSIKEIIIWNKIHGVPAMEPGVFNSAYEFIIIFSKDQPNKRKFYDVNFRGNQNNVFIVKNTHSNPFSSSPQLQPFFMIISLAVSTRVSIDLCITDFSLYTYLLLLYQEY